MPDLMPCVCGCKRKPLASETIDKTEKACVCSNCGFRSKRGRTRAEAEDNWQVMQRDLAAVSRARAVLAEHGEAVEMARDFAVDRETMGWDEHDLKLIDCIVAFAEILEEKHD